jgi:hypothetical protein
MASEYEKREIKTKDGSGKVTKEWTDKREKQEL